MKLHHAGILASAIFCLSTALGAPATHPGNDPGFMILPDGRDLRAVSVKGARLVPSKGGGGNFTASHQTAYVKLKAETKSVANHKVQWVLMDLDSHQVIDQSMSAKMKIFGASTSKIFVAGALMDKQQGQMSKAQLQLMADMLVVSSNTAWVELQRQVGGGNDDKGREYIHGFTQRMGYERMRGFQGWWGKLHGNELTAAETADFLYDTYHGHYPGAVSVWKVMYTCRTGISRARKYLPADVYVGGKTGTYDGDTVDPETGKDKDSNGKQYIVHVRNHALIFNAGGKQYGLAILANNNSDEQVAVLAGGLFREYTRHRFKDR